MKLTLTDVLNHNAKVARGKNPVVVEHDAWTGKESDLHRQIISELKSRRIYFVHSRMDRAHTNGIGTTDFILAMPAGKTLWLEIKTAKGKLTREQAGVALLLKIAGHAHHEIRSFEQFLTAIEAHD